MSDPLRDAYVEALETENETLRATVLDIQREFGFHNPVPLIFGLTPNEAVIMSLMLERDMVTRQQLMTAVMSGRGADIDRLPEMKIIDVWVCKIRSKLKPFGIEIETVWGRGYHLSAENKIRVRAYLEPVKEAAE